MITEPGIYATLSPAEYHADPAPVPSLSASVAIALVTQTPFHAWMKHPRLCAEWREELKLDQQETSSAKALGSVAHELLLGRGHGIHVIQAANYRTKAAQEERDKALDGGAVPCLEHELEQAEEVVDCIRQGLKAIPGAERAFDTTADPIGAEVAALWREPSIDVWGRILVDWWHTPGEVWDLKTTTAGLSDEALRRKIANDHLDLRCAWYERGVARLFPEFAGRIRVNLVFVEQKPPYEVRVVRLGPATLAVGHKKVAHALGLWAHCLRTGQWPGYPREIARLDLPAFAERSWLEREETDDAVREAIIRDPFVSTGLAPREHEFSASQVTELA